MCILDVFFPPVWKKTCYGSIITQNLKTTLCNLKYEEVCVLMLLTGQHQAQVAQVEGPGQAVGHVHLPPLADVWHLHLRRALHRNRKKDVTTPHLCSGHLWEGVGQEKKASLHPSCPFLCGTDIFLDVTHKQGTATPKLELDFNL